MAFEAVEPGSAKPAALRPGIVSLGRGGQLIQHTDDLRQLDIEGRAVVLVDVKSNRIGVRRSRLGESSYEVSLCGRCPKRLYVLPALRLLCLDPADAAGRFPLIISEQSLMGFIVLPVCCVRVSTPREDDPV